VFAPETWGKSNPNLLELPNGQAEKLLDSLKLDCADNEREGTLATFVNKSLNIWSRRFQNSFLSLDVINKAVKENFDPTGREVYIGFDASQFNDNTSFGFEFPYTDGKAHMFYAMQHSFIPFAQSKTLASKSKQDGLDYEDLERRGLCSITNLPSGVINRQQVYQWLVEFIAQKRLKVRGIIADPNLADWFVKMIENYQPQWPILELRPTSFYLSTPTKDFQNLFINGNISIPNDPLLIDGFNNAILVEDKGGAIKIDRQNRTSDHIDTADAIINAHSQAQDFFQNYHDEHYNPMNDMDRQGKKNFFKALFGG
jgi:phage terminase large subunit-like protein